MARPFRFGVQHLDVGDPAGLPEFARRAEALGYDELFSYDHVGAADPFIPLMIAAAATRRLRIGPLVLNNEFHHPAMLARTAATVDVFTGGRLVLGMGTGYQQSEHDAIDVELRPPGPRVDRFGESLTVLRDLLDTGRSQFDGEYHRLALDDLGVRPVQDHVPLLIGGYGRRVVGIAARFADIFQFTGLTHAADGTPSGGGFAIEQVVERGRWLTELAGERDAEIERSALVQFTAVGDDAPSSSVLAERFDRDAQIIEHTPFSLSGNVEQIVDKLERIRESTGISHYVIRDPEAFAPVVAALATPKG